MNSWHCDICGKETFINPPVEPVMIEKEIKGQKVMVQDTVIMRSMDYSTGEMVDKEVGMVKDLKPRAHIVRLTAGQQSIQRDFCEECLHKLSEINGFWNFMEKIGDR